MNTKYLEIGVDIGKKSFDASMEKPNGIWPNNTAGIDRFIAHLGSLDTPVRVSCEATGGYTRMLA